MKLLMAFVTLVSLSPGAGCDADAPSVTGSGGAAMETRARGSSTFPLQAWMKANVQPAMTNGDANGLAVGLDRLSAFGPEDYGDWKTIAARGAAAARSGDLDACRAACQQCHDRHRARYRARDRGRALDGN